MILLSDDLAKDLMAFLKDLHDPEGYGFSVTEEVHQESIGFLRRMKQQLEKGQVKNETV